MNVFTMEQVLGLFSAAQKAGAPVIVQLTPVARGYAGSVMLKSMIDAAAILYPEVSGAPTFAAMPKVVFLVKGAVADVDSLCAFAKVAAKKIALITKIVFFIFEDLVNNF